MSRISQFPCPRCGYAYSRATTTTKARSGVDTRRQRTCEKPTCGSGFVTYEIKADDYEFLQAARRFMENNSVEKSKEAHPNPARSAVPQVRGQQPSAPHEPRCPSSHRP